MYVIYTKFPVGEFAERMRVNHPEWSDTPRQWYNCIRWQGQARKHHISDIGAFQARYPDLHVDSNPEALGVNVTEIIKQVGIDLEWNYHEDHDPTRLTYRVSIGGNYYPDYVPAGNLVERTSTEDVEIVKQQINLKRNEKKINEINL